MSLCGNSWYLPIPIDSYLILMSTCAPFFAACSTFSAARDKLADLLVPTDSCIKASLKDLPVELIDDILELFHLYYIYD